MDIDQLLELTGGVSSIWQLVVYIFGIIIASSVVIEISPIKINPLKKIIEFASKSFKAWFKDIIDDSLDKQLADIKEEDKKRDEAVVSLTDKVDKISDRIDMMQNRMNENEKRAQWNHIKLIRSSILSCAEQIRQGNDPSQESFNNALEQYDEYEEYITNNKLQKKNGKLEMSIKLIKRRFDELYNKTDDK